MGHESRASAPPRFRFDETCDGKREVLASDGWILAVHEIEARMMPR